MPWHNKNKYGYLKESTEAHDNATMVMDILSTLGWGKAAVCAALGNFEAESSYNPWRWQSETVLPVGDSRIGVVCGDNTGHAYGIFQSDPAANYIYRSEAQAFAGYAPNYSNRVGGQNDGTAQMHYLNWVCTQYSSGACGGWNQSYLDAIPFATFKAQNDGTAQMHYLDWVCTQYSSGACGGWNQSYLDAIPFATFKAQNDLSTYTIAQLTKIFHDGYERSARWSSTSAIRIGAAQYWWDYFGGYVPPTPSGGNGAWFAVFHAIKKRKSNFYAQPRKRGGKIWRCLFRLKLKTLSRPALRRTAL